MDTNSSNMEAKGFPKLIRINRHTIGYLQINENSNIATIPTYRIDGVDIILLNWQEYLPKVEAGRVLIDIDEKIRLATSEEEKKAWESQREKLFDMDFCEGWHVGMYKQMCGHWEVLQSPVYGVHCMIDGRPYTAEDADRELKKQSAERRCTRCN